MKMKIWMLLRDPKRGFVANARCTGQGYQVWIGHVAEMGEEGMDIKMASRWFEMEVRQERRESSKELLLSGRKVVILRIRSSPTVKAHDKSVRCWKTNDA